MNQQEQIAAKKTARLIRAARKELGLTQGAVAERLGISQGALSRLEHGILIPSAPQWFEFCAMTGISTDSLLSGQIERNRPAKLEQGNREGTFKIPKRYARNKGSKVRALIPFLSYFQVCFGADKLEQFLDARQLDADFFVDVDNQISLELCMDIARELIGHGYLRSKGLQALTAYAGKPETHGSLRTQYDRCRDTASLLNVVALNSRYYECNFNYAIEAQTKSHTDLSVTPERHLSEIDYRTDPKLGDFLCEFKKHYFGKLAAYGDAKADADYYLEELECHYHGAPKCVYRIRNAS